MGWIATAVGVLAVAAVCNAACRTEDCPIMCAQIAAIPTSSDTLALDGVECLPHPTTDFGGHTNITRIIITNCSVTTMENGYLTSHIGLQLFSLTHGELQHLGNHSLSDEHVKTIDLSYNKIAYFIESQIAWIGGGGVSLNLSHNSISYLDPNINVGNLPELDISYNALTSISAAFTQMFVSLEKLHAHHNRISVIENGAFGPTSLIEFADFSYNELGTAPLANDLMANSDHLSKVNMSNNPLTLLPVSFFSATGVGNVRVTLDVHNTHLSEPPGKASVFKELYVDRSVLYGHRAPNYFGALDATLKVYDPANPGTPATYNCKPGGDGGEDCSKLAKPAPSGTHRHSTWGVIALAVTVVALLGLAAVALWHHRKTHGSVSFKSRIPGRAAVPLI